MMEEVIVNNMEMDDVYEEEQLNQIEMEESETNNKNYLSDLIDDEIKVNDVEIESGQNIKQGKEYRIDFNSNYFPNYLSYIKLYCNKIIDLY